MKTYPKCKDMTFEELSDALRAQNHVRMVQRLPYSWDIVSASGHVMQSGVSLGSVYQAQEYVKKWISSFNGWTYEIITLEEK